jgi:hypothetical protein
MNGLGRILASETSVSDLLAYFTEEEPERWKEILGRAPTDVERESGHGTLNRADLVLRDEDGSVIGAVEVKLGHRLSPEQASWYEATFGVDVPLILASLDLVRPEAAGTGARWTPVPLSDLIGRWADSSDPAVAAIAAAAQRVLAEWSAVVTSVATGGDGTSDDVLSTITEPFLGRVLTRALEPAVKAEGADATSAGVTLGGGNAILQAWRTIPERPKDQFVMAEVRWQPARPVMDFRFGIEVEADEDPHAARQAAWELAQQIDESIRVDAFLEHLRKVDPRSSALLSSSRASGRPAAKGDWAEIVKHGFGRGDAKRFNPGFYRDGDLRFEAQAKVDTSQATGPDVVALLGHALRYLEAAIVDSSR